MSDISDENLSKKRKSSLDHGILDIKSTKRARVGGYEGILLAQKEPAVLYDARNPTAKLWPVKKKQLTFAEAKAGTDVPVRIYADGVFDMFHSGHARALMQAKNLFPNVYLIVGAANDADTHKLKGFTVMTDEERYESLRHCRYIDEIICDAPWIVTMEFLDEHQIDFVAHDDLPYNSAGQGDIYQAVKDAGKFAATQRTPKVSTSDMITRIVRDYDLYVQRNLDRGYSKEDMNVGFIKGKELAVKKKYNRIKDKSQAIITNWEDKSRDIILGFISLFGRDSVMSELWDRGRNRLAITSQQIKEALSPVHTTDYDRSGPYYGDISSDEDDDTEDGASAQTTVDGT